MKALVYAIPIDDDTIKIGSHLGTIQKLISRYQTTTNSKYLSQGVAYGVEENARLWMEMMISTILKRYGGWIEGEKFNINVKGHFCSLADQMALSNSKVCLSDYMTKVVEQDKVTKNNSRIEIEIINEKLEIVKLRKLREKLLKEERKEAEKCANEVVNEMLDRCNNMMQSGREQPKNLLTEFLRDENYVIKKEGASETLEHITEAFCNYTGTKIKSVNLKELDVAGFQHKKGKICKSCRKPSVIQGCCDQKANKNRSTAMIISGIQVKEWSKSKHSQK